MFGKTLGTPMTVEKDGAWTTKTYKRGQMTITLTHNTPSREAVQRAGEVLNAVLLAHIDDQHRKQAA